MKSYKVSVTTTRVLLLAPDNLNRTIYLHHDNDNDIVYIGDATVTSTDGFHLHKLDTLSFFIPAHASLYAIKSGAGAVDVWVLAPSGD
jgi:hypothetical protein